MSYVDTIVDAFGGVRPMAHAIDKPVSTVMSWKSRGSIPDAQKAKILRVADALGIPLEKEDFFPSTPDECAA